MEKFDKGKLKDVETVEKNVLPTAEDIKQAKETEETPWNNSVLSMKLHVKSTVELELIKRNFIHGRRGNNGGTGEPSSQQ